MPPMSSGRQDHGTGGHAAVVSAARRASIAGDGADMRRVVNLAGAVDDGGSAGQILVSGADRAAIEYQRGDARAPLRL